MLELRQLRCFVALAQEKHFQRAARLVNLTQPALSYQLKSLEEKLGISLIERDRRNVSLTEAGEYLMMEGKALLQKLDDIVVETAISPPPIGIDTPEDLEHLLGAL